jgi:hypothetical protein
VRRGSDVEIVIADEAFPNAFPWLTDRWRCVQRLILWIWQELARLCCALHERRELLQTRYALGLDLVAVVDIGGAPWLRGTYR